ncbi:MAG: NAD(P)H-dependent oxidoreductase [Culicoidibacterales bacterium]
MTKLLVLLGSPMAPDSSNSAKAAMHFVEEYRKANPEDEVEIVKIFDNKVSTLSPTVLMGSPVEADMENLAKRAAVLAKFKTAQKVVLAAPMWNFSLPGYVKEYIDCFFVAGETFKYLSEPDENGKIVAGLAAGKKVLHIQATGGFHKGTQADIGRAMIKQMFDFIGIDHVDYVAVEGAAIPGMLTLDSAKAELTELANKF